jgi:hypothetical protein
MKKATLSLWILSLVSISLLCSSGCSSGIAPANQLTAPEVLQDNSGEYMCPYRQDGTLADWSAQVISKVLGAEAGKRAGWMAGAKLLGGAAGIGKKVGEKAGEKLALEAAGGMEGIRRTSDISSNSLDDLAVFMYVNYSEKENYNKALRAMYDIYPKFKQTYPRALAKASAEQTKK